MITICFTFFKSLSLANLEAALFSVSQQDFTNVKEIVFIDNDTYFDTDVVSAVIERFDFPVSVRQRFYRHNDPTKTHAWSTNVALNEATTPLVLFTRADYILSFDLLASFRSVFEQHDPAWRGFVTGHVYHLNVPVERCNETPWQTTGVSALAGLPGVEERHTKIDAGVWMGRREDFENVGGMNQDLTAWGHAQTEFQHRLYQSGVEFIQIPRPMFFHPRHAGERDLAVAHEQLAATGTKLRDMWARYEGVKPY